MNLIIALLLIFSGVGLGMAIATVESKRPMVMEEPTFVIQTPVVQMYGLDDEEEEDCE